MMALPDVVFITEQHIRNHATSVLRKLEVSDRVQAVLYAASMAGSSLVRGNRTWPEPFANFGLIRECSLHSRQALALLQVAR
jgi:hypothetical protein